jgi:hypothetical protein
MKYINLVGRYCNNFSECANLMHKAAQNTIKINIKIRPKIIGARFGKFVGVTIFECDREVVPGRNDPA